MGEIITKFISLCKCSAKANIVKVFSFTAMSTLIKMLTGLISVKVVASIIGPSGIALLGQLRNFSSIAMALSSGGINNGIVKYVAEYKDAEDRLKMFLSTALRITLICSVAVGLLMIVCHRFFSNYIMLSSEYDYVFIIFGCTILFYALNMMLISVLNGYKEFKKYVVINIAGSITGLIFTVAFVFLMGLKGALISAVTYQSVILFVTCWMARKCPWLSWSYFKYKTDALVAKKYIRYTMMTLVSAATVPVTQMLLRGYVISHLSSIEAGWWEGMNRISAMYLMIITSSFGVYYLPRLSELTDRLEISKEIRKAYKIIIPVLLIGIIVIYLLRYFIIRILFTADFLPMENLFIWQLLGDFFKICSWLLAFLMVAKSMMKLYVTTEIIFSLTFLLLGIIFVHSFGIVGAVYAYLVNYILYMIGMFILFKKFLIK